MNRLAIAQKLRQESGVAGTGPSTTVGLTSGTEYAMLVSWIDDAYREILNKRNWLFQRDDATFNTTSGTSEYSLTAMSLTDLKKWVVDDCRCYLAATGTDDEQEIYYYDWNHFKRTYLFGSARSQTGRPTGFTIKPDNSIVFWPVPDATYTFVTEYFKSGDDMDEDDDEPIFPSHHHMIIVWAALKFYGASYVEDDKYAHAENEYRRMLGDLKKEQLPQMGWGAPLC